MNSPLRTALGPASVVNVDHHIPADLPLQVDPPENDEIVSVSSTIPVAALMSWICSTRPAWFQSTA